MTQAVDNQKPTFSVNWTAGENSDGEIAAELAAAYYEEPQPWQRDFLDVMLARDHFNKLLHPAIGLSVPRQNGKSWDVRARCKYGVTVLGERILYTCHNQDTADEMRKLFCEPFMDRDKHPDLFSKSVVRQANGQGYVSYHDTRFDESTGEMVEVNGYIFFTTRSNLKSRGQTYDVIIYDEAQELTKGQQKASLPTISAGPRGDSQAIYIGTPEDENSHGDVFPAMRRRARGGTSNAAWAEWALECKISELPYKVQDRDIWRRMNPGWDYIMNHSAVEGEFDGMEPREFAGDRLGWWMPDEADDDAPTFIPRDLWSDTSIPTMEGFADVRRAFGLKFSRFDGAWALAGCAIDKDGMAAFELVEVGDSGGNLHALGEQLAKRKSTASCVIMDGLPGTTIVTDSMGNVPKGFAVQATTADVANACGRLYDELDEGSASHVSNDGQAALDIASANVEKRRIGNSGGWGFEGPGYVAMEACALALWAARNSKRNPRRKQVIL